MVYIIVKNSIYDPLKLLEITITLLLTIENKCKRDFHQLS